MKRHLSRYFTKKNSFFKVLVVSLKVPARNPPPSPKGTVLTPCGTALSSPCLQAPTYRLKTSHSYYTQIQCQLAVTGLQRADLVVYTRRELAVVPVTFDPDKWEETVSKLELFYTKAVLPHLRATAPRDGGAAWTPEL